MPISTLQDWNDFINKTPQAHVLQSPAWGELKSAYGWETIWIIVEDIGAQVLFQKLPFGYQVAYIARGPVSLHGSTFESPNWRDFQDELDLICQSRKAVFLKVEPDSWQGVNETAPDGYLNSKHSIQPPRTIVVNLEGTEEQILQRMKSKTRYNIRLAEKKGVTISKLDDVEVFYSLLANTSHRAEFGIHTLQYYQDVYRLFNQTGGCQIFLADYEGEPLASIMVFVSGRRSWYFYGASGNQHRKKMPTYLVQWEAMRWAKSQGCQSYDLWGVPDEDRENLEENFTKRSDGLWGVYRFKRGFGGELVRYTGLWEKALHPLYPLGTKLYNAISV